MKATLGTKRFVMWRYVLDPIWRMSDLLYYDHVIAPGNMLMYAMNYMMDWNCVPDDYPRLMDSLIEKGYLIQTGSRLVAALRDETAMPPEEDPSIDNFSSWIRYYYHTCAGLDDFCDKCFRGNMRITTKYDGPTFDANFHQGQSEVLSVIYKQLPSVDVGDIDVAEFLSFLGEEETRKKRIRMFSWQNSVEMKIQNGSLKPEHIPELMADTLNDYTSFLANANIKTKETVKEFIVYGILSMLTVIGVPSAAAKLFEYRKKRLELKDDLNVKGRELAYIVHAQEREQILRKT